MNTTKQLFMFMFIICMTLLTLAGCSQSSSDTTSSDENQPTTQVIEDFHNPDLGNGWKPIGSMDLQYAKCFTIDYFEGGYQLACISDGHRYLIVPEGATAPAGIAEDIIALQQPASDIYLVASDTACLFDALDALDTVTVSGIAEEDWYIPNMKAAMEAGTIVYGGKYRSPDYEALLATGVRLAIESTMINHTPDVKEKLNELGIPVFVEMSSYESEPLGRTEWVKFYGALLGKDDLAQQKFQEQVDQMEAVDATDTGKTVAFFYINSNGGAVVRKPGDYVTSMIEQAGGTYIFNDLDADTSGMGSATIEMERFYSTAKDADIVIYNSSIDSSIDSLDALLAKNELLGDFKAIQNGDVWVTDKNMYQQMMESGSIIADFNRVFNGATGELTHMKQIS